MPPFDNANPDPVTRGGTLHVVYHDANKANQTVHVDIIDDGEVRKTVTITLDAQGHGSEDYDVPLDWQHNTLRLDDGVNTRDIGVS